MSEHAVRWGSPEHARQKSSGSASGSGSHRVVTAHDPLAEREQASVQAYFDSFAAAMTSGDMPAMTRLWGVPAFVIGPNEARAVQSLADVEEFFAGAKQLYAARGITRTDAEITHLDWIEKDLVIATVRWPYLDQNERVLGEESSSYTLLRGEDGGFKLRVITLRGSSAEGCGDEGSGE
jgi:hypothetical protein